MSKRAERQRRFDALRGQVAPQGILDGVEAPTREQE